MYNKVFLLMKIPINCWQKKFFFSYLIHHNEPMLWCKICIRQHKMGRFHKFIFHKFSSVAQLCPTLCKLMDCARQASPSITSSWSLLRLMSIKSVMPSNHLNLCCPLLFLPSIITSIRDFSDESALYIRWPKYWSFSLNINPCRVD